MSPEPSRDLTPDASLPQSTSSLSDGESSITIKGPISRNSISDEKFSGTFLS
jgi:hypothetical protein